MTVLEKGPAQRPAYIDGKTKLMLIDGRWVERNADGAPRGRQR